MYKKNDKKFQDIYGIILRWPIKNIEFAKIIFLARTAQLYYTLKPNR
jgi:hypothetical protein